MTGLASSCVPGIRWPGLGSAAGAQMLAMQWQLERTQWWPVERLREYQLGQLRLLVAHAVANVPLYRAALRDMGVASAAGMTLEDFRRWPILRKDRVRENEDALRAVAYPKEHGPASESYTTGSIGAPLRVFHSQLAGFFANAFVVRDHLLHQRDLGAKLGTIRALAREERQAGWGTMSIAFATGPATRIGLEEEQDAQLDWLVRERPRYLLATPNSVRGLALRSRERGLELKGLAEVLTYGAMLPSDLRAIVREIWQVPVTDAYSCVEAGPLASQCPGHEHYLVHAENVFMEILRDDGSPCAPGEVGRVVITPLHNFAMPLIRYELGDYAEAGAACPTGRGLPVLRRIAGRVRNLLRDPRGGRRFTHIPGSLWYGMAPIRQVRLVQHSLEEIEVQYVMDRDFSAAEAGQVVAALRECLGYPFDIRLTRVPAIERQKGGKFEEFLSLLPQD